MIVGISDISDLLGSVTDGIVGDQGLLVIRDGCDQWRLLGSVIVGIVGDQGLLGSVIVGIVWISDSWDCWDQ